LNDGNVEDTLFIIVIWAFCVVRLIFCSYLLSVPVQVIAWKDLSLE